MIGKTLFAFTCLAAAGTASAATTTLDFAGAICGVAGNQACGNSSQIGQNYGDGTGIDVSYRSIIANTGGTYEPFLKYWQANYGDLTGVIWGGAESVNYISEIVLTPLAGYEVSLSGFDFATYVGRSATGVFSITSVGGNVIYNGALATNYPLHNSLSVMSAYFTDGIVLRWGPDGYDVGLDNISFDVRATAGAVPEPESWALMIAGFALVGGAARRRRSVVSRPA